MGKDSGGDPQAAAQTQEQSAERAAQIQAEASREATEAQRRSALEGINLLQRQAGQIRADISPQRLAGFQALDALLDTLGLPRPAQGSFSVSQQQNQLNQKAGRLQQIDLGFGPN